MSQKFGVRKAFQQMTNEQLRDYLTIQLILRQAAIMVQTSFDGDLFKVAVQYANQNVETAEKALLKRGLSVELCHQMVMDVFLAGAPDLSPEEIIEDEELAAGHESGDPVVSIVREFDSLDSPEHGPFDPNAIHVPKLSLVDGERPGAEI